MIERTTYKLKGTLRIDFETDRARLDSFPALESDWNKLLHRLTKADEPLRYHDGDGEEDMLYPFLENQELTVFADITRKKLSNYGNSFANVQGTAMMYLGRSTSTLCTSPSPMPLRRAMRCANFSVVTPPRGCRVRCTA